MQLSSLDLGLCSKHESFSELHNSIFILHQVCTPADWTVDKPVMIDTSTTPRDINEMFKSGVVTHFVPSKKDYMRTVGRLTPDFKVDSMERSDSNDSIGIGQPKKNKNEKVATSGTKNKTTSAGSKVTGNSQAAPEKAKNRSNSATRSNSTIRVQPVAPIKKELPAVMKATGKVRKTLHK